MRFLGLCIIGLGLLLGSANMSFADGEMPFPLGGKAPLPWEMMDGYWTDWKGQKYFYRIEVLEIYKDGSRTVSVAVMDDSNTKVVGSGLGFVRANSRDLWANVTGESTFIKFRLQAFFPKNSIDLTKRALVASLRDMNTSSGQLVKHALIKVDALDARIVQLPENHKKKAH